MSSERHRIRLFFIFIYTIILAVFSTNQSFSSAKTIIGDEIKARIILSNGPIISDSDSLFLNGRRLKRGDEYQIDYIYGFVNLTAMDPAPDDKKPDDTLVLFFSPLPSWLKKHYGIRPGVPAKSSPSSVLKASEIGPGKFQSSTINISGVKKFSIVSQTQGTSQFNQTLELTVSGELRPGVEISGSISDRGYDPAYGAINSRISELDKLSLKVRSKTFSVEIGSLELSRKSDFGHNFTKQISGLKAHYADNILSSSFLMARPRGNFKSVQFIGQDQVQGPYRIVSGSQVEAIVPGSEKIWLDGVLLDNGAERDYIMDYPSATITFTPIQLIDSRSRIEIDYEPLTVDYQREIYQASVGVRTSDSAMFINMEFTREGDIKQKLKIGELSADDIGLLQLIGDKTDQNFQDGAVADSVGDYIENFDSLNNRFFEYVGDSMGDYRVGFTPVESGQGDYLFEGGNKYRYVGLGGGDYMPLIRIPVPEREDFFEAELGLKPNHNSLINLVVRQTVYDKNIYSTLNDNNNHGGQYVLNFITGGKARIGSKITGLNLSASLINNNFKPRNRRNRPDLKRQYLIPISMQPAGEEREINAEGSLITPGPYQVYASSGLLDYRDQFSSYYGTAVFYPDKDSSFLPQVSYTYIKANLDSADQKLKGNNEIASAKMNYYPGKSVAVTGAFKFDRRWNQYASRLQGTTEQIYDINISYHFAALGAQRYYEDTLKSAWENLRIRDRLIFNLFKRSGALKGEMYLTVQKLTQGGITEDQFLSRISMSYSPVGKNLSINNSYSLTDENRFERGLRYIEVEPGQGQYIFEDGQYIPDQEGNFIRIEEVHSAQSAVKRGEKSFTLFYGPKDIYLRLVSNVTEELIAKGKRNVLWTLPFYSDENELYLFRKLNYAGDLKLWRRAGYYFVNLGISHNFESRTLGGADFEKYESALKLGLNEPYGNWRFIQEGTYFENKQSAIYFSPGEISGFNISAGSVKQLASGQLNLSLSYRHARDTNKSESNQYLAKLGGRLRLTESGESSFSTEIYRQDLDDRGSISYRLTDNRFGKQGINWILRSDYKFKGGLRISISFNGRHSDDRKPRIVGRGELIASF